MRTATEAELGGGDSWRLYDFVARHFLGSISPDSIFRRIDVTATCGGESFKASGATMVNAGFTAVMPWRAVANDPLPSFQVCYTCVVDA